MKTNHNKNIKMKTNIALKLKKRTLMPVNLDIGEVL